MAQAYAKLQLQPILSKLDSSRISKLINAGRASVGSNPKTSFVVCGLVAKPFQYNDSVIYIWNFCFLYQAYIIKYEILILTNRRIIGSVNPGLFTKDKIDLMFKAVDNIQEDESFLGNLFGWSKLVIESRSASYPLSQVTKESVRYFKERFYEQLKLIGQV